MTREEYDALRKRGIEIIVPIVDKIEEAIPFLKEPNDAIDTGSSLTYIALALAEKRRQKPPFWKIWRKT